VQELGKSVGLDPKQPAKSLAKAPSKMNITSDLEWQKSKIMRAQEEYKKGVQIQGTLAEIYLRKHRHINGELPNDFRFRATTIHPYTKKPTPALVAPIRDKDGQITGVVRTFLNADGSKLNETFLDQNKQCVKAPSKANLGIVGKGAVTVQAGLLPMTLWVAEGIETALSVAKAMPNQTVMASLSISQLKNIPVHSEVQKIIICADNDGNSSNSQNALAKAVEHHLQQGKQVFLTMPEGPHKRDFNDLLKQSGAEAVRASLEKRVEIKSVSEVKNLCQSFCDSPNKSKPVSVSDLSHSQSLVRREKLLEKEMER
jgi:phage/plasmid primase-like uncharacterized protein